MIVRSFMLQSMQTRTTQQNPRPCQVTNCVYCLHKPVAVKMRTGGTWSGLSLSSLKVRSCSATPSDICMYRMQKVPSLHHGCSSYKNAASSHPCLHNPLAIGHLHDLKSKQLQSVQFALAAMGLRFSGPGGPSGCTNREYDLHEL